MGDSQQVELIKGTVDDITFQNKQTGFTVLELEDGDSSLTVVGVMPDVCEGEVLELGGTFDNHPTYGRQFRVMSYVKAFPSDSAAILKYLSSGTLKGIGPATAKRIVKEFKDTTFDVLLSHPELTATVKGITYERALEIQEEMSRRTSMRDSLRFFAQYGFRTEEILRIYGVFHENSIEVVSNDPYQLIRSEIDISFARADAFAETLSISKDSEMRIRAGIIYVLKHNLGNGHTCLPLIKVLPTVSSFLDIEPIEINEQIVYLIEIGEIASWKRFGEQVVSLREYYASEHYISSRLEIMKDPVEPFTVSDAEIEFIEQEANIKFEKLQREAIKSAGESGVMIISGGPGTGKTTVLNALIEVFNHREMKISLAAPTGRAAKRMTEITGVEAKTIHRLLEVERIGDTHRFKKCEKDNLDCDVLIIDEMSMVDTLLFEATLKALPLECRIILVGDHDQLPSVGAGDILRDMIASKKFNCTILKTVFRQAMESKIVVNAHKVINGEEIGADNNGNDFYFIGVDNPRAAQKYVSDLCTRRLPDAYNTSLFGGVQVLCPSRKMMLGVDSMNIALQNIVNPPEKDKKEIQFKGFTIREGDKVMQVKNNYDIVWNKNGEVGAGVFNGDIGRVDKIDVLAKSISVVFDDERSAVYSSEEIFQLELAYAVTVHKSQGSEFDYVVLPISDVPPKLRYRNLLYTGITRAKKMLIIVGDSQTVNEMINNDKRMLRYTGLECFLEECRDV